MHNEAAVGLALEERLDVAAVASLSEPRRIPGVVVDRRVLLCEGDVVGLHEEGGEGKAPRQRAAG